MEAWPSEEQPGRCPADLCGRSASPAGPLSHLRNLASPPLQPLASAIPPRRCRLPSRLMEASGWDASGRGHEQKLWVVPPVPRDQLRGPLTEELFLFTSLFCPPLVGGAGVAAAALMHAEGAFEESASVLLFHPLCTSPHLRPSVFSLRFCPYLSLKTLCIPSFNFWFSHSHLPALGPVPSSFLMILFFSFLFFCRAALLLRNWIF